jgi:hypothetical protein
MSTSEEFYPVPVIELNQCILAEKISCAPTRNRESFNTLLRVTPEQITEWTIWWYLLESVYPRADLVYCM